VAVLRAAKSEVFGISGCETASVRSGLPANATQRLERVRAAVEVPAPTTGYDSDVYAWSDAQELYRTLADWAARASRGEDRSSTDEEAHRRLHQLLDMPGVADLLGPAGADARILADELFEALHVDRPRFDGESPETARMRNTAWLGVLLPAVGLLIGGFAIYDLAEEGVSLPGVAAIGLAVVLAGISARFWMMRLQGRRRTTCRFYRHGKAAKVVDSHTSSLVPSALRDRDGGDKRHARCHHKDGGGVVDGPRSGEDES
jgi:hypothetical protein